MQSGLWSLSGLAEQATFDTQTVQRGVPQNCDSRSEAQEPDVFLRVPGTRHLSGEQTGTS